MDKHFEPVTARSLADKIVDTVRKFHPWQSIQAQKDIVEHIITPHIRKPSDDDKPIFDLPDDISMLSERFNQIIEGCKSSADRTIKVESLREDVIDSLLHYKAKSVPARCEEAYDGAINLIMEIGHRLNEPSHRYIIGKIDDFLQKPNPFKEAVITDDKPEPRLLPFDLKAAQDGAKVVTHGGKTEVKIVADNISSSHPILATYSVLEGGVYFDQFDLEGRRKHISDKNMNLFILKEPETVEIELYRHKYDNSILVHDVASPWHSGYMGEPEESKLIKTITVQI